MTKRLVDRLPKLLRHDDPFVELASAWPIGPNHHGSGIQMECDEVARARMIGKLLSHRRLNNGRNQGIDFNSILNGRQALRRLARVEMIPM